MTLRLELNRWRCQSESCSRLTFSDQLPALAAPYARRTRRTAEIASLFGHSAGGRPGERLMRRLGMPASDDTILRQLKRDATSPDPAPRVIGIDDWSWRRSSRYGTIIVDLERRSVVDVLEDRSVSSAAKWLQEHPSVEIVARDRCGLYARAIRQGAQQAQQVADRFHLVQNLREAIEQQMSLAGRATGRALLSEEDMVAAAKHLRLTRDVHRQSREEVFARVLALSKEGLSCADISRRTGHHHRTITKWLTFDTPPDRRRAALKPTSPLYFEAFLTQCWKDGNRRGQHLFRDIRLRGYTGSFSNLERLLCAWRRRDNIGMVRSRTSPAPDPDILRLEPVRDPETGHGISSVVAAALCIKPRGKLTCRQARKVDALKQGSRPFAVMRSLAMRFNGLLRGGKSEKLDTWIDDAIASGLAPVKRFAQVLRRDIDAVRNAIELPWSNGQAEGQINRLKTIKRAMYGKAGSELLRARMLPIHHTK